MGNVSVICSRDILTNHRVSKETKENEKVGKDLDVMVRHSFPTFFPVLKFHPKIHEIKLAITYIHPSLLPIIIDPKNQDLKTIGDTILIQVKLWFSHEVGKDFRKWENGGVLYYHGVA